MRGYHLFWDYLKNSGLRRHRGELQERETGMPQKSWMCEPKYKGGQELDTFEFGKISGLQFYFLINGIEAVAFFAAILGTK